MARRSWLLQDVVEIFEHWQAGRNISQIAQSLGVDRKTVRKYVQTAERAGITPSTPMSREEWHAFVLQAFPEVVDPRARSSWFSELEAHSDFIREQLATNKVTTVWRRLVERTGLSVSLSTFRRFVRTVMPDALPEKPVTVWRPEVEPGEEGQVDFGHMGYWRDPRTGKRHRIWAFILVLSFSRHMFVRFVRSVNKLNWLECHGLAFAFFGAVMQRIILDNLKDGVVKADIYDPRFNRAYAEMAAHYGVLLDPARSAKPKDKPRVERQVPFVRESLWQGQHFLSLEHMNAEAERWCLQVAGLRIHGTTRQRPLEVYEAVEKPRMRPLPAVPWELATWTTAKVGPDCHAQVDRTLYSIPFRYRGERLDVRLTSHRVEFYHQDTLVKTHPRREKGRQTDPGDLPADKIAFYERTPQWCLRQAKNHGESVFQAVRQLLEVNTLTNLRQAQGVIRLVETYGPKRLDAACRRALEFGDPRYRTVKTILERGLDAVASESVHDRSHQIRAHLRGKEAFTLSTDGHTWKE